MASRVPYETVKESVKRMTSEKIVMIRVALESEGGIVSISFFSGFFFLKS